ncbi:prolyl oligopeptidase [Chytriomyces cf. hyalinus JEL632]|nr:prolyl oligopeptidase [Chytriomyces cf. hyalinus JEL632]
MPYEYPTVRRDEDHVDLLHGVPVKDPYRHLEDPDAPETKAFVEQQGSLFQGFIQGSEVREKLVTSLTESFNYERYGVPFKKGDNYYYFHNSGLQPQALIRTQKTLDSEATVFFDPNALSEDGTVSLGTYSFSESGNLFGYALSSSGSDWVKIHVRQVGSDTDLEEKPIEWAKFTSISFTHDEKGFFYERYPSPTVSSDKAGTETDASKNQTVCYHRIGTPQEDDIVVWSDSENPERMASAEVSDCGRYLLVTVSRSTERKNLVYYADLEKQFGSKSCLGVPELVEIVGDFNAKYSLISTEGSVFYFETTLDAPNARVVKYDIEKKAKLTKTVTTTTTTTKSENSTTVKSVKTTSAVAVPVESTFEEVIPEFENALDFTHVVDGNKLILVYLKDVKHVMKVHDLSTGVFLQDIELPTGSIIKGLTGSKSRSEMFYAFQSHISPGIIRRYDFATKEDSVFSEAIVEGFDSSIFEVKQIFYPTNDGTMIPMYIIHKKDTVLNGENPTLLYAYGGFTISILPAFSVAWLTFIQKFNGVVAVANIRGGGEYGMAWHDAGKLFNKQNCYYDFQNAARYLIDTKYTCPKKLAINGGSNGGLLVGACLNQTPELFGLGIAEVGVMDMLRFHKFTIGAAWVSDFGSPEVKDEFENLLKISPLHNVDKNKTYPAVLLITGDHDDRVVPLHSMKLAATMQYELKDNPNPIMMRVNTKAGHGAGKSMQQFIEEAADKYTFLSIVLEAPYHG